MAKTLLMKTWLMVVVVALALVLAASISPFAEDANAQPCKDPQACTANWDEPLFGGL